METTEIRPGVFLKHHPIELCQNDVCPIHNPSNHGLRSLPLDYNYDLGMMVRLLPGGNFCIDPDDYKLRNGDCIIRNEFFCRKCEQSVVSKYRHDFATCACGNFTDGGRDYIRRGGNMADILDTSVYIKDGKVVNAGGKAYF